MDRGERGYEKPETAATTELNALITDSGSMNTSVITPTIRFSPITGRRATAK